MEKLNNDNSSMEYMLEFVEKMKNISNIYQLDEQQDALKKVCGFNKIGRIKVLLKTNHETNYNTLNDDVVIAIFKDDYNPDVFQKYEKVIEGDNIFEYTVYAKEGCSNWDTNELRNIDALITILFACHSQMRIKGLVHKLMYEEPQFHMPNSAYFVKTINNLDERGILGKFAVARFNIRNLGMLNRKIGREITDDLIFKYVGCLQNIIGSTGVITRLGGDNFDAIFEKQYLSKVLESLSGTSFETDASVQGKVKMSSYAGIVEIRTDYYTNPYDLIERMNVAYKTAKENKQDYALYDGKMDEMRIKEEWFKANFEGALKNNEFVAFYQPKVDSKTNALVGAEALCRWFHDDQIVRPDNFIPFAEANGDICTIDLVMLENVCRDMRKWLDMGLTPVRISVNLSRVHIGDDELLNQIFSIIDKYNVPCDLIEIELTETVTDVNFGELCSLMDKLHEKGMHTAIDDFGVGYSSLNLVSDLPWDVLKIDKKFLPYDQDEHMEKKKKMLTNIINMVKELDLDCIVEGVETQMQVDFLKEKDCTKIQGYYYDKPLPINEFEKRLMNPIYDKDDSYKVKVKK